MRHDFSKTLLRCHYLGDICNSEGKNGGLSVEAKKRLVEVYWEEKYGKRRYVTAKSLSKGLRSEYKVIELIAIALDQHFEKNEEKISNDYLKGTPDIFLGEEIRKAKKVWDAKCSDNVVSFGHNLLNDKVNTDYVWQLHGYMALTGAKEAAVAYGLVTDEVTIRDTQKSRFYAEGKWISEESPEWLQEAASIEQALTYDDIPAEDRLLVYPVERDENKIITIYNKVLQARTWLEEYQEKHIHFNKKHS